MANANAVINAAMEATGLSARGLSRVIGVDERTMRRWQAGDREMPEPVVRLLRLLTVSPENALLLGE